MKLFNLGGLYRVQSGVCLTKFGHRLLIFYVRIGTQQLRGVNEIVQPWRTLPCSVWCMSNKIWTQITHFFYLLSLIMFERAGKNNC